MISQEQFLTINLAIAFYNVGTIWAHEIDIFRSWKMLDQETFQIVQKNHWHKLPYWVFIPVGLSFLGSVSLFFYHPNRIPSWQITLAFCFQFLSHLLTGIFWGPWQAKLAKNAQGGKSVFLAKILKTHWIRTLLITSFGMTLLYMTMETISSK